jgi:uncharacterized protein (DUF1015 family)
LRIKPFKALRPREDIADKVAAVPYDVVSTEEAAVLAAGNPLSLLHVSRPEIDLPRGTDPHSDAVYAKAVENFRHLQNKKVFVRERTLSLYVYRQTMGAHSQRGIVTCCTVEDYDQDVIKKHERTRRDKEEDRTRHVRELNAHTGPVFLAYRGQPDVDRRVAAVEQSQPLYDFTAGDGIRHTVWRVADAKPLVADFARVPFAYIADGHHRAAAAARVGRERRAANPRHRGNEEYNWFLAVLFPADQLQIMPYNRCVKDLNGMTASDFLAALGKVFEVSPGANPRPASPGHVSMYLASQWYSLAWQPDPKADPVAGLDVSVLQDRLLSPLLGIADPRTSDRIEFVGGIRGPEELVRRVDSGEMTVAFSMFPVTMEQIMAVADSGQIMPPKSTWFEPKLRSGLLIHTL